MGGITPGLGDAAASMWFAEAAPDDGDELLGVAFESATLFEAATAAAAVLYPLAAPPPPPA